MKKLCILLTVVLLSFNSYSQATEFPVYSNGLIYDTTTMNKLGVIVDSLNLKFKSCDLNKRYYSYAQGLAHVVSIPSKKASALIKQNATFKEFKKVFPRNIEQENYWVLRTNFINYHDQQVVEYSGLPNGRGTEESIILKDTKINSKLKGWILNKDEDQAFYLVDLKLYEIPEEYARLFQYVDCMIDTTAQIFLTSDYPKAYPMVNDGSDGDKFIKWAGKFPNQPTYPDYDSDDFETKYAEYNRNYSQWNIERLAALDVKIEKAHYYKSLLMNARDEALSGSSSDAILEFYVARYLSKEDALEMKRRRKVVGMCSMDNSPRYHAMEISTLAAETAKWDIFLRSHLNVMNDRFSRASDGSYAQAGRKTYLREIEVLGIEAVDLLLGISLRSESVSDNHYLGSINRVGRALSDAENKHEVTTKLLAMIGDKELDPFNRFLMAYVFSNFNFHLDDETIKSFNDQSLEDALAGWPEYMRKEWGD